MAAISSTVSPCASMVVTGGIESMAVSIAEMVSSGQPGNNWIKKPPAHCTVRSGFTSTPKAHTEGVCSDTAK